MKRLTDAQKAMVEENISLVWFAINKYGRSIPERDLDDAYQFACLGLIRAASTYDPDAGVKFSTYAVNGIRWYITRFVLLSMRQCERLNRSAVRLDKKTTPCGTSSEISISEWLNLATEDDYDLYAQDLLRIIRTKLSPRCREITFLLIGGHKQTEIAKRLGISRQRVNHAIKRIQEVIRREYLKEC